MFTLLRSVSLRSLLTEQAPTLALSLTIAEVYFKFHSFLLETGAFLLTWFALDAIRHFSLNALRTRREHIAD